jgi:hypothetical protein
MCISKSVIAAMLILALGHVAFAKESAASGLSIVERVIVFAVQQEVQDGHVNKRKDVCLGLGDGLNVDERAIISALKRKGVRVHTNAWCNRGPRGLRIGVIAPIKQGAPETYEFVVDLTDLSIRPDEHLATRLRRGTYVIRCDHSFKPQLISYTSASGT